MNIKPTIWKDIPGHSRYAACESGGILDKQTGYVKQPCKDGHGYYHLALANSDGTYAYRKVHQLILETFVGPRPDDSFTGEHKDRNKANNALSNLEWLPNVINCSHTREQHGMTKLSFDDIKKIKASILSSRALAKIYKVTKTCILDARKTICPM
jgi:predicted small metal-binding protein